MFCYRFCSQSEKKEKDKMLQHSLESLVSVCQGPFWSVFWFLKWQCFSAFREENIFKVRIKFLYGKYLYGKEDNQITLATQMKLENPYFTVLYWYNMCDICILIQDMIKVLFITILI